jgi:purine-binding chemotaxis protein CheW
MASKRPDVPQRFSEQAIEWQGTPQEIAEVWARRAEELARVPPRDESDSRLELLVVRLARETYGFEAHLASDIQPAERVARVPRVPPWIAGVTNVRGRILSVLDLAHFFGLAPQGPAREREAQPRDQERSDGQATGQRVLVVVETPQMELALVVDEVLAIQQVPLNRIQDATDTLRGLPPEYVRGVVEKTARAGNDGLVLILDLPALLADEKLIVDQEVV